MSFDACFAKVIEFEGPYDFDSDDVGGETCFGITRQFEKDWPGWSEVEALKTQKVPIETWHNQMKLMTAVQLYYSGLWARHRIGELPEVIQAMVFGGIINQGPRVVKWLQFSLGKLCQPCDSDGIVGRQVIEGCQKVQLDVLFDLLWKYRMQAYITAAKKGNNSKFLAGWANRLEGGA